MIKKPKEELPTKISAPVKVEVPKKTLFEDEDDFKPPVKKQ